MLARSPVAIANFSLVVMGTSLNVNSVANMAEWVKKDITRVLRNDELVESWGSKVNRVTISWKVIVKRL